MVFAALSGFWFKHQLQIKKREEKKKKKEPDIYYMLIVNLVNRGFFIFKEGTRTPAQRAEIFLIFQGIFLNSSFKYF